MEPLKIYQIEQEDMDYMQYINFIKEAYKNILGFVLLEKNKGYEYSKENYEYFMNEYKDAFIKYEFMINNLVKKYAPEHFGRIDHTVTFDFEACEMIIYGGDHNEN